MLKTKKDGLNALIDAITENQELIVEYNSKVLKRHLIKRTLFQKLFSIVDYLKKLKVDNQFIHLQVVNKL
ncbi:hypothetical protein [Lacinutrix sp. MedPE-SW]|uniref:hypothetical protein n=1 Tax=Lacinutrix sp. MedPE-SW TaxID=1860087 RepID=UPI0025B8A4F4|nr:hypothetical protein [Lacinutrix sp. MedPE-SW]